MKYIVIILVALVVFLGVGCRFLFSEVNTLKENNAVLRAENNALTASINDYNESQKTASETIAKIQKEMKNVKTDCNCYDVPVDDAIIDWVRGTK